MAGMGSEHRQTASGPLRVPEAAPEPRRLSELPPGDPAEWTPSDAKHAELVELRATVQTLREQLADVQGELERALGRELATRGALGRLAAARIWQRRGVVKQLRARGLVR